MRFINRGTPGTSHEDIVNTTTANVVLQIGPVKMPIKAEKLLGASVRVGTRQEELLRSTQSTYEEDKVIEAFSRMEEELSGTTSNGSDGNAMPWSPDSYGMPSQHIPVNADRIPRGPLDHADHVNPPPAYTKQMKSQQTAESAVRDMALHKGGPTIFDSLREAPPRRHSSLAMKQHQVSRRSSKTTGHTSSRPKKLDLVQLFPQPRPATGRLLSPERLQHSPAGLSDRANSPLPPLPSMRKGAEMRNSGGTHTSASSLTPSTSASGTAGGASRRRVFDEDIFDQHKTHVRRPPKGIQNWFDAFLDTDEDEEQDVSEEESEEKSSAPEPLELPAEDVLPPAYVLPSRHDSRMPYNDHQHQTRSLEHLHDVRLHNESLQEQDQIYRSESVSRSWDSIQSSHIGLTRQSISECRLHSRIATDRSVLSVSESEYTDEDEAEQNDERVDSVQPSLPPIRDSIYDDRNFVIGSASALGVRRLPRPQAVQDWAGPQREQLRQAQSFPPDHAQQAECDKASHTSSKTPTAAHPVKSLPATSLESLEPTAEKVALRKLQVLGVSTQTTDSSITANQEQQDARDSGSSSVPSDAAHMMAVTEEEMMLLDLMRRKRMMMQQMSFTEGYQLAMKTEQERLAKRTESAELRALKALRKREDERRDSSMSAVGSPTLSQNASDMRRQLSKIRKEQVDEAFHIERFLSMSQPQPLASHPWQEETSPVEDLLPPPARHPSGELLPATVYSPASAGTPSNAGASPAMTHGSFASDEEIKRRVQHFIETKGAPPPLNTMPKTMQRPAKRGPASMPPSPVVEEEQAPAVPKKSPDRFNHGRKVSEISQLTRKVSSVSLNGHEPRDDSPVSALSSRNNTLRNPSPVTDEKCPPRLPAAAEKAHKVDEHAQANLERSTTVVSQLTSSPTVVRNSPVSPFTNIINAATAPKPLSAATANWTPAGKARRIQVIARAKPVENKRRSTMDAVSTDDKPNGVVITERSVPAEEKTTPANEKFEKVEEAFKPQWEAKVVPAKPVCKLNTVETIDEHGSLLSITSAGEEVLAAWGELGGGPGALRTKLRVKPSGPLSDIMNSPSPR